MNDSKANHKAEFDQLLSYVFWFEPWRTFVFAFKKEKKVHSYWGFIIWSYQLQSFMSRTTPQPPPYFFLLFFPLLSTLHKVPTGVCCALGLWWISHQSFPTTQQAKEEQEVRLYSFISICWWCSVCKHLSASTTIDQSSSVYLWQFH